jgi:hypothetical protein
MRNVLLTGVMVFILLGCSSKKESDQSSIDIGAEAKRIGNIIMPLELGNWWSYNVYGLDTAQNTLRPILLDTLMVISDTTVNQERWFHIGGLQGTEGWVINREDGFWFAPPGQKPFLFAKYPAEVGDTFSSVIGSVNAHTTVEGIGVEVKSPAGTYYCYKYSQRVEPSNAITNYYFAPGVGLVKMEIMDRSGRQPMAMDQLAQLNVISRQEALLRQYRKEHEGDSAKSGKDSGR